VLATASFFVVLHPISPATPLLFRGLFFFQTGQTISESGAYDIPLLGTVARAAAALSIFHNGLANQKFLKIPLEMRSIPIYTAFTV